jgi:glycosyltransferase involved in cell wall biosynthesis
LPLVITKISGASELVGEDEAGIIVERNAKSIGSAIARMAADADLRSKLGTAARERAEPYTWSRSGRAFQEVVESLIVG